MKTITIVLVAIIIAAGCAPDSGRSADVNALQEKCGQSATEREWQECKAQYQAGI
jgi:hypothetical protein